MNIKLLVILHALKIEKKNIINKIKEMETINHKIKDVDENNNIICDIDSFSVGIAIDYINGW